MTARVGSGPSRRSSSARSGHGRWLRGSSALVDEITDVARDERYTHDALSERRANAGRLPMSGFPTRVRLLHTSWPQSAFERRRVMSLGEVVIERTRVHVLNFHHLYDNLKHNDIDEGWLGEIELSSHPSHGFGPTRPQTLTPRARLLAPATPGQVIRTATTADHPVRSLLWLPRRPEHAPPSAFVWTT